MNDTTPAEDTQDQAADDRGSYDILLTDGGRMTVLVTDDDDVATHAGGVRIYTRTGDVFVPWHRVMHVGYTKPKTDSANCGARHDMTNDLICTRPAGHKGAHRATCEWTA